MMRKWYFFQSWNIKLYKMFSEYFFHFHMVGTTYEVIIAFKKCNISRNMNSDSANASLSKRNQCLYLKRSF